MTAHDNISLPSTENGFGKLEENDVIGVISVMGVTPFIQMGASPSRSEPDDIDIPLLCGLAMVAFVALVAHG
jgi:hypothetical protein